MGISQFEGVLLGRAALEVWVCPVLEQEFYDTQVDLERVGVHAHRYATEVHKQRAIHAHFIYVGAVGEEHLSDAEAQAFVLKRVAICVLCQPGETMDQRCLTVRIHGIDIRSIFGEE